MMWDGSFTDTKYDASVRARSVVQSWKEVLRFWDRPAYLKGFVPKPYFAERFYPHCVKIDMLAHKDWTAFCEKFKLLKWSPVSKWTASNGKTDEEHMLVFRFKSEDDAVLFKMVI